MKNERTDVKVIGVGLLVLYAVSIFLGISFTLLFIARRFYASYRQFAFLFAQTVYRDFCALP